jgi:hypothetical protein
LARSSRPSPALILGIHAGDGLEDLALDSLDRLQDALAAIALAAIAHLHRLVGARGGPGGHGGPAEGAVLQQHVDLDGRIAAAVEDFTGDDIDDGGHGTLFGKKRVARFITEASSDASPCGRRSG